MTMTFEVPLKRPNLWYVKCAVGECKFIKRTRGFTTGFALIWTMPGDMQVYPIFYDYRPHKHDEPVLLAETGPDHLYDDDDLDA